MYNFKIDYILKIKNIDSMSPRAMNILNMTSRSARSAVENNYSVLEPYKSVRNYIKIYFLILFRLL